MKPDYSIKGWLVAIVFWGILITVAIAFPPVMAVLVTLSIIAYSIEQGIKRGIKIHREQKAEKEKKNGG